MRLLKDAEDGFGLTEDLIEDIPAYAILSHTWSRPVEEEVTFRDLKDGTAQSKRGWKKIEFCGKQATRDGLRYFWVDTCCINRSDSTELSEAINSMFRWYRDAAKCYVYLSDVSKPISDVDNACSNSSWKSAFCDSRWFTRGWTLQELIAPRSVEFFSLEGEQLGNKTSLEQDICKITGIPVEALHGNISDFSYPARLAWAENRKTTRQEDGAYALLGICDVSMPLIYGEGRDKAFRRLWEEINKLVKNQEPTLVHSEKDQECIQQLCLTDPYYEKMRIEDSKGGLLEGSYRWILDNSEFQEWLNGPRSRLLWIRGAPGKGKTMLLCGLINELKKSMARTDSLSYFFCQATDVQINNATAVLRGLVYLLIDQQPSLVAHVRKKYDRSGKALFEDEKRSWFALSEILSDMLQDPRLSKTYLIIDALDECTKDLPKLLNFIVQISSGFSRVKWIVSSRNWLAIEEQLNLLGHNVKLCLELSGESISTAVHTYIQYKVLQLAQLKKYDSRLYDSVQNYLLTNANDTFLWVALVCKRLGAISRRHTLVELKKIPPGLDSIYEQMMTQINHSEDADLCKQILAITASVYRPITLEELLSLVETLEDEPDGLDSLEEMIQRCGSFLSIQEGSIYFVHQSAKDYLKDHASGTIFSSSIHKIHYDIFSRSLLLLNRTLHRNIYKLDALGCSINEIKQPDPDLLAALRYSCIYWIDHLCHWLSSSHMDDEVDLQDGGTVDMFMRKRYLHWLEAVSLCRRMPQAVLSMARLEASLFQRRAKYYQLLQLVHDASRFVTTHKYLIENYPLQIYASALLFSPSSSLIRIIHEEEAPKNISIKPAVRNKWSPCLQTLEGHKCPVTSVAFFGDSSQLVTASSDGVVKIWDTCSGECLQTLKERVLLSTVVSPDSSLYASFSRGFQDYSIKIRDINSGKCLQTLQGHDDRVNSVVFSHDHAQLASASWDCTVKIWEIASGNCLYTLNHMEDVISIDVSCDFTRLASTSGIGKITIWDIGGGKCLQMLKSRYIAVVFSHDCALLATSTVDDGIAEIWDAGCGKCLQTLEDPFNTAVFSHGSTRLISASWHHQGSIKIWNITSGTCLQTLRGHGKGINFLVFSHDHARLASASYDGIIDIWNGDASSDSCLQTLEGHGEKVNSIIFSHDLTRLVSASDDGTIKIWEGDIKSDKCLQISERHRDRVESVIFSHDFSRLVSSTSYDEDIKIWDTSDGKCLHTLTGHSGWVNLAVLSPDSTRLASASSDSTIRVWDISSGRSLHTLSAQNCWYGPLAFSHDSMKLASTSDEDYLDYVIKVWDISSGNCLRTFQLHGNIVSSLIFSHDSSRLVSELTHSIIIWDMHSDKYLQIRDKRRTDDYNTIHTITLSHDSTRLALTSSDYNIGIWDIRNGEYLQALEGHTSPVRSIAFSHDSTRLATTSYDNTVKIWDANSGECLQTYLIGKTLSQMSFDITDSRLHTEAGIMVLNPSPANVTKNVVDLQDPQFRGWGLSSDNAWITYNSKHLLWLPSEYRPSCAAVLNTSDSVVPNMIGCGVGSGRVWIYSFKAEDSENS